MTDCKSMKVRNMLGLVAWCAFFAILVLGAKKTGLLNALDAAAESQPRAVSTQPGDAGKFMNVGGNAFR